GFGATRKFETINRRKFSNLRRISGNSEPSSRRTKGVRRIVPAIRFRASRISSNSIGRTGSKNADMVMEFRIQLQASKKNLGKGKLWLARCCSPLYERFSYTRTRYPCSSAI